MRIWNGMGMLAVALLLVGSASVPGPVPTASARKHVIEMKGFEYRPANLRAQAGDTIEWVNRDAPPHTATADNRDWDTGNIAAGAVGTIVIRKVGEHGYFCILHPTMRGKLTVTAK
jgi:plastocyanin